MPNSAREFDIIIFGATGYTGRYVIEELVNSTVSSKIKWAVAGRNIEKLQKSLEIVQGYVGQDISILQTTIIKADVENAESLSDMCKRAKLILNCVGPYKFYGEAVVKACIENGTHHVDISGEMKYLETIQANYFDAAQKKKVYIVEACGFDCIPSDYGISLMKKKFPGDLNSVEYFVEIGTGPEGRTTNMGTFLSAIYSFSDMIFLVKDMDKMIKEKVFKKDLPPIKYPLSKRMPPIFYSQEIKKWCLWFMGPDERNLIRSQKFRYEYLNERPVQSEGYVGLSSLLIALSYLMFASLFACMSMFSPGRYLLSKFPSFFTAGAFSKEGPTRKQVMEGSTKFTLYGKGWKDKLSNASDQHVTKPDTKMKLTITGPEAGYRLTSACMVQAGLTILNEPNNLPLEGGVLTPGVAFENTALQDRLEKSGIHFKFETD